MRRIDPTDQLALARMHEVLTAAESADGTPPFSDQALLAIAQGKRALFELAEGSAYGVLGEGELDLVVHPDTRGRGVGRQALAQLLGQASAGDTTEPGETTKPATATAEPGAATTDDAPGELRAWAHGTNPAARHLLAQAGFEPVRELLRMTLDPTRLHEAMREARPLPAEFHVQPFDPADFDRHADEWVRVNAAAFAAHPEQGAMTRTDFDTLTRGPWFNEDDLRLAFDVDGALAGFAWVKTVPESEAGPAVDGAEQAPVETELYAIGVDPGYAGRGLGAALLGETLRQMAKHQPVRITLYVDGDNVTAVALYERAGFEVEQRSTQYLLRSEPASAGGAAQAARSL